MAGLRAWNRLPPPLRRVHSAAVFKRQLKTFYSIVLLTDTTLLGALVVLWHLRHPNLDVLA